MQSDGTVTIVYPGVCDGTYVTGDHQVHVPVNATWPSCGDDFQHHYSLVVATPRNASDPFLRDWAKHVVANRTERDPSGPWLTSHGEWRLITWDGWEYGTTDGFKTMEKQGQVSGLPIGDCPSLFVLPAARAGDDDDALSTDGPTHVYKYSWLAGDASADWYLLGRYTDPPPIPIGAVGLWQPFGSGGMPDVEHKIDGGAVYASKDFYDPVKRRRIMWGHISAPPTNALTLPRVVTYDKDLEQLNFSPLPELAELRLDPPLQGVDTPTALDAPLVISKSWPVDARSQCEMEATFAMPSAATNLSLTLRSPSSIGGMTAGSGTRFVIEYTPPPAEGLAHTVIVTAEPAITTAGAARGAAAAARRWSMPMRLLPRDTELRVRLYVDHTLAEAYWLDGRAVMSVPISSEASSGGPQFEIGASGHGELLRLQAWRLGSIWVESDDLLTRRTTTSLTRTGPPTWRASRGQHGFSRVAL